MTTVISLISWEQDVGSDLMLFQSGPTTLPPVASLPIRLCNHEVAAVAGCSSVWWPMSALHEYPSPLPSRGGCKHPSHCRRRTRQSQLVLLVGECVAMSKLSTRAGSGENKNGPEPLSTTI
jgi:hypothetical protein